MDTAKFLKLTCSECGHTTKHEKEIALGENSVPVTCAGCGERWDVSFYLLSIDPPRARDLTFKRLYGFLMDDGHFFSKEQLQ